MINSREEDDEIIYELYKLSSVVLPEKNTWSIDEISLHLSTTESNIPKKTEITVFRLKNILKKLEGKQAVIFVNGFKAFSLVEPKLLELVNVSKSRK
jgi:hypothetical protein